MDKDAVIYLLSFCAPLDVVRWRLVCKDWARWARYALLTLERLEHRLTDEMLLSNMFPNLVSLNLMGDCRGVSDSGLASCTRLRSLSLYCNRYISNRGLSALTNLTSLNLRSNQRISDEGLRGLSRLTRLDVTNNMLITDEGLLHCPLIQSLKCEWSYHISREIRFELTSSTDGLL